MAGEIARLLEWKLLSIVPWWWISHWETWLWENHTVPRLGTAALHLPKRVIWMPQRRSSGPMKPGFNGVIFGHGKTRVRHWFWWDCLGRNLLFSIDFTTGFTLLGQSSGFVPNCPKRRWGLSLQLQRACSVTTGDPLSFQEGTWPVCSWKMFDAGFQSEMIIPTYYEYNFLQDHGWIQPTIYLGTSGLWNSQILQHLNPDQGEPVLFVFYPAGSDGPYPGDTFSQPFVAWWSPSSLWPCTMPEFSMRGSDMLTVPSSR